eukprot:scaffold3994_cov58-Phaeocystis_antarctica.AAC.1
MSKGAPGVPQPPDTEDAPLVEADVLQRLEPPPPQLAKAAVVAAVPLVPFAARCPALLHRLCSVQQLGVDKLHSLTGILPACVQRPLCHPLGERFELFVVKFPPRPHTWQHRPPFGRLDRANNWSF